MFGLSLKVWSHNDGEEEEELSLVVAHNNNIIHFLQNILNLLVTDLSLDLKTLSLITQVRTLDFGMQIEKYIEILLLFQFIPERLRETRDTVTNTWHPSHRFDKYLDVAQNDTTNTNTTDLTSIIGEEDYGNDGLTEEDFGRLLDSDLSSIKPRSYKCEVNCCEDRDQEFSRLELRSHQQEIHPDLFCESCKQAARNKEEFASHKCDKKHKCPECGRDFSTNNELQSHALIHSGRKPHMCDLCGKWFRQKATLNRHKLTHQTARMFKCNVCDKSFKHKHYLTHHMRVHEGLRPHVCSFCDLSFSQHGNMVKHVKQKHTGDKAHVCHVCNKGIHEFVFKVLPTSKYFQGLCSLTTSGAT